MEETTITNTGLSLHRISKNCITALLCNFKEEIIKLIELTEQEVYLPRDKLQEKIREYEAFPHFRFAEFQFKPEHEKYGPASGRK